MSKILFNATPFGYGPVSKTMSVIKKFVSCGHECVFVGSGIAYEYVHRENLCETILMDLYNDEDSKLKLLELSKDFTYGITAMEPLFVDYCDPKLKIGYIDSLFWMWDKEYFNVNYKLKNVDKYFAQNTFDIEERTNRNVIKNFINTKFVIDLIFSDEKNVQRQNQGKNLVIHFGGVENVYIPFENIVFPFEIFKILNEILENVAEFSKVIVVSSEKTVKKLNEMFPCDKYEFVSLAHAEFAKVMKACDLLITTPGLTTLIESFSLNVKTIFLMPQNFSQYLILHKLKKDGYPFELFNLDYFYSDFNIQEDIPEEEAVNYINKYLKIYFNDEAAKRKLRDNLNMFIDNILNDNISDSKLASFQNSFIRNTGIDGVEQIYNEVIASIS
jgi:hypothetical protein